MVNLIDNLPGTPHPTTTLIIFSRRPQPSTYHGTRHPVPALTDNTPRLSPSTCCHKTTLVVSPPWCSTSYHGPQPVIVFYCDTRPLVVALDLSPSSIAVLNLSSWPRPIAIFHYGARSICWHFKWQIDKNARARLSM